MGLSVGQLLSGAGQVAKGQLAQEDAILQQRQQELKLQEQNRLEDLRARSVQPTLEFLNQTPTNWSELNVGGNAFYGDGIRQVPVEAQPQPAVANQPAVPAQPAAPATHGGYSGKPITMPGTGQVSAQQQQAWQQANQPQPVQPQQFKPGVGPFAGKQFNWMQDGPSLVNPMLNAQGQMSEQAYQATRLELMKRADAAKQKMQQAGPLAGNEEYFYYQNQLNYVDSIYGGLKRQGKVVAANAEPQQQLRAKPEERVKMENLGGYQLPKSQLNRLNGLSDKMPAALQQQSTLDLVNRAVELGVDPAAAVAVYALENNYGGQATSGAGARGSMQIMPDTYNGVRSFYTNSKNGMPANLQQLAAGLPSDISKATPEQLRDAGLLYMYQLQTVNKIPTNMLGAAYHAGPNHESFKQGLVPNVYDKTAKVWTPDHNAMYVSLYNQFTQLAGGKNLIPQAQAQQGNQGQAQANQFQPGAPVVPQTQQTQQAPVNVEVPQTGAAQRAGLKDTVPKLDQPQVEMPPVGAFNPQQYDVLTKQALGTRDYVRKMAVLAAQTGNINKSNELTAQLMSIDADLYKMVGDRGVAEFTRFGDPSRMLNAWSTFTGTRLQVQPRSDGKYDLYANGQLLSGKAGIGKDELIAAAKEDTDAKYVASKAALREWTYKEQFKTSMDITKKSAEQQGTMVINNAQARDALIQKVTEITLGGQRDIAVNAAKSASEIKVANAANGDPVMVFYSGDGRQIGMLNYNTKQFVTAPGGEQISVAPDIRMIQGFGKR